MKRLSRLDQVRALSDPTRIRLLELFKQRPMTTMQAATLLDLPPTRLYHHVKLLQRLGVIKLVEERPNRGTIEKYFQAVARAFSVDPALFEGTSRRAHTARSLAAGMLTDSLDRARREAADAVAAGLMGGDTDPPAIVHVHLRMTAKGMQKAKTRLHRCVADIQKHAASAAEGTSYTLLMGCYPIRTSEGTR